MNYGYWEMVQHFQELTKQLQFQQNKISQLETILQKLQAEVDELKQNAPNVERIEYKFDQLKVEKLEGTLNIGITPHTNNEESTIEDFTVDQNNVNATLKNEQEDNSCFKNIEKCIHDYLDHDGYYILETLEQKYSYQLDVTYRQFIIEDIKRQIDNRILYYLNNSSFNEQNREEAAKIEEMTINKLKEDIYKTCEEFIRNLPRKGYE